jgi:hypothetical protein
MSDVPDADPQTAKTYLKLSGIRKGLPLNFAVPTLKQGLRRFLI